MTSDEDIRRARQAREHLDSLPWLERIIWTARLKLAVKSDSPRAIRKQQQELLRGETSRVPRS